MIRPQRLTVRQFDGMLDTLSGRPDPRTMFLLKDCYVHGADIVLRPGWDRLNTTQVGVGAQSENSGLVYYFTKLNGTVYVVLIYDGQVYVVDSGGTSIVLTTAQLTAAGITLSATAPCYAVTFNDQMVITDGVNKPWMWTGAAGAGLTLLTNTVVAFGPPAVYYAKLFFIKNTDRGSMIWSEENQANTGYEAGGYNNVWTLGQTGSQPLVTLLGTNEGLYYFRERGIGLIRGAVTTTFSTTGTHDAVSSETGCIATISGAGASSRAIPVLAGSTIWFVDRDSRPFRLLAGGTPEPLWPYLERRYSSRNWQTSAAFTVQPFNVGEQTIFQRAQEIVPFPPFGHVYVKYTGEDTAHFPAAAFDAQTGQLLGLPVWLYTGPVAFVPGYSGGPTGVTSALVTISQNRQACAYYIGSSYGADETQPVNQSYVGTIIGPAQGYDEAVEWQFDEIDLVFETNDTTSSTVSVDYLTDEAHYSTLMAAQLTASATDATYQLKEQRERFGIAGHGSWIRVRVQMSGADRIAIKGWTVLAYPTAAYAVKVG